jgi:hypothetical protein
MFVWMVISVTIYTAPADQYKDVILYNTRAECEHIKLPPDQFKCTRVRVFMDQSVLEKLFGH